MTASNETQSDETTIAAKQKMPRYGSLVVVVVLAAAVGVYARLVDVGAVRYTREAYWLEKIAAYGLAVALSLTASIFGGRIWNPLIGVLCAAFAGTAVGALFQITPLACGILGLITGLLQLALGSRRVLLVLRNVAVISAGTVFVFALGILGGMLARNAWIRGSHDAVAAIVVILCVTCVTQVISIYLLVRRRKTQPRRSARIAVLATLFCVAWSSVMVPLSWTSGWHLEAYRRVTSLRQRGNGIQFDWNAAGRDRLLRTGPMVSLVTLTRCDQREWSTLREFEPIAQLHLREAEFNDDSLADNVPLVTALYVFVDHTEVTGRHLDRLPLLSRAVHFHAQESPISNEGLADICKQKTLVGVGLVETQVDDAGLANLKSLPGLSVLTVHSDRVGDSGMKHLGQLAAIQRLYLDCPQVTPDGLAHLGNSATLTDLWMENPLDAEGINAILPFAAGKSFSLRIPALAPELERALQALHKKAVGLTIRVASREDGRTLETKYPGIVTIPPTP